MYEYDRIIRIPLFPMRVVISESLTSSVNYSIMSLDLEKLHNLLRPEINNFNYRHGYARKVIIVVGRDVMSSLCDIPQNNLYDIYQDLTSNGNQKAHGFGVILNGESIGINFMPANRSSSRELTDRERLSTAHIQAVTKIVAEQGNQQRGEYADGWMACIRVMCQNLGVEIPENIKIPFQGMHVNDLTAKILEEMKSSV